MHIFYFVLAGICGIKKEYKVTKMSSKIYLYAHGGSGNHGCEAIVRSTVKLLEDEDITLISSAPEEDISYGVDKICNIVKDKTDKINYFDLDFIKAYLSLKIKKDYVPMDKLWYKKVISKIQKGDIAISIGGDNYCYADVKKYVMLHEMMKSRGAKTVLWGCSVEPDVISIPEIAKDLARYDLITARESITYNELKKINNDTVLVPDTAFALQTQEIELPKKFIAGNTVGINVSPMVIKNEKKMGIAYKNYVRLIDEILNKTSMSVALIPHVVWADGDDRILLRKIYELFKNSNRILMIEDCNCQQLKYIISKCRFFVGARTHATIAAYSTGVPTIVMGYSVKARGIARDLFGKEDNYVIPVQEMKEETELLRVFDFIMQNEEDIRKILNEKSKKNIEEMKRVSSLI